MRQSSTAFMDELLKDNAKPTDSPDLSKQIADAIDKKMEQAMAKFEEQISKVVPPEQQETPPPKEDEVEDESNNDNNEEDNENE